MPMSSGGRVASSSGCATKPKAREIGWTGYAGLTQHSLRIGHYVMATAEHREPCDSRGSCTVLGAPGGEIPPGDSAIAPDRHDRDTRPMSASPVRRDKAALSSGCESHPANAPAGSNRSSYGGDEVAEPFG